MDAPGHSFSVARAMSWFLVPRRGCRRHVVVMAPMSRLFPDVTVISARRSPFLRRRTDVMVFCEALDVRDGAPSLVLLPALCAGSGRSSDG
eukprot:1056643-Alexandrium_andersonii.AAC.1